MAISSALYVVNDGFVRKVSEEGPGIFQVLFVRSLCLATIFVIAGRIQGQPIKRAHLQGPVFARVAAEMAGTALLFAAIVRLDFANAQAILQVIPLAVMFAAVVVLHEQVRLGQIVAILIGFVGVLIIVRPATDGFSIWSLAVVASATFLVLREFATRRVDPDIPAWSVALVTAIGIAAITGTVSLFEGWQQFNTRSLLFLSVSVICLAIGYVTGIVTVRVGDLSVSAPFRYTALVAAVVVGYLLFEEVPDEFTILGSLLIVATGIYAGAVDHQASKAPADSI